MGLALANTPMALLALQVAAALQALLALQAASELQRLEELQALAALVIRGPAELQELAATVIQGAAHRWPTAPLATAVKTALCSKRKAATATAGWLRVNQI